MVPGGPPAPQTLGAMKSAHGGLSGQDLAARACSMSQPAAGQMGTALAPFTGYLPGDKDVTNPAQTKGPWVC